MQVSNTRHLLASLHGGEGGDGARSVCFWAEQLLGVPQFCRCSCSPVVLAHNPRSAEHPDIVMTRAVDAGFLAKFAQGEERSSKCCWVLHVVNVLSLLAEALPHCLAQTNGD